MTKNDRSNETAKTVTPLRRPVTCPQCDRPSHRDAYPFCSKRCADLDLGAWLNGQYAIVGTDDERSSDAE